MLFLCKNYIVYWSVASFVCELWFLSHKNKVFNTKITNLNLTLENFYYQTCCCWYYCCILCVFVFGIRKKRNVWTFHWKLVFYILARIQFAMQTSFFIWFHRIIENAKTFQITMYPVIFCKNSGKFFICFHIFNFQLWDKRYGFKSIRFHLFCLSFFFVHLCKLLLNEIAISNSKQLPIRKIYNWFNLQTI